jgi:hypothetical protein
MARDAQAIAFGAFAQAHEPLPELLALAPAAVPLALPSMVGLLLPIAPALGLELVNDTMTTALAPCSASVPMVASAKSWKATATKTLRKRSYKNKATTAAQ